MKPKKILIIDDEKDFGLLMKDRFSSAHYEITVAYTIADGLRYLEKEKPDFIFLDNNLPDGYGWSVTEYILSNYPGIKLNLISGLNPPKTSSTSFRILGKPVSWQEITEIIE